MRNCHKFLFFAAILFAINISVLRCETDPDDFAILDEFRKGLNNPELLKWPTGSKDPCGEKWPHVYCSGSRIGQIQVQRLGLSGTLPPDLNKLTELVNVGLQNNNFSGPMPSFKGLSKIQYIFLDNNQFDTIPADFFVGLTSLQVLQLSNNPLNKSTGWMLPKDIQASAQISKIYLIECNLIGPIPEFLGSLNSLTDLEMSYNKLSGPIPASFNGSALKHLWLNNQDGPGLSGTIDLIGTMPSLTTAWLHGNAFTGTIPSSIGELSSLQELWLNNNQLVGLVPDSLASIRSLQSLRLDNNKLMGPIPKIRAGNFSYSFNSFCQEMPGVPCAPEVMALLEFLGGVNYPLNLAASWSGNDPCSNNWLGVSCSADKVSIINLPNANLNGTLSPSLGKLDGLVNIRLGGNNLEGTIPSNLTSLKSLKLLNVSSNNLGPPVPKFSTGVTLLTDGNPLLDPSAPKRPPPPPSTNPPSSPGHSSPPPGGSSSGGSGSSGGKENHSGEQNQSGISKKLRVWIVIVSIIVGVIIILLILVVVCRWKRKKGTSAAASSIVVHPKDPSDPDNMVKIVVANNATHSTTASDVHSATHSGATESHLIESGNLVVSVQILREVTRNFSSENEVGRGGFGVVYKGELYDGTMVAVKRMESTVISNKGLDEFQAEIAVLSKVRHRNLVSLLGYSVEGNEKLLVYEYMPKGALSKHLFEWKKFNLEPLSWKKRLNIALDVARGMEYLHNLAHHCFIHRDLKSSNILLGDDYRAKVSDFGLVKLAPHGKTSVVTRLAGTFGYLAPEYAVTGKITTKADVFSFGVVLMELLTGLKALDESRCEEKRYLASWFCSLKLNKEKLRAAIDETLDVTDETFEIICILAELAGHCAAREPYQRPDMGHAVNVLAPLVEKWKPANDDQDDYLGIDLGQPLLQMVKGWQAAEGTDVSSSMGLDDSKGSIPARPVGFAESFTSADGR